MNMTLIALLAGAAVSMMVYVIADKRRISKTSHLETLRTALEDIRQPKEEELSLQPNAEAVLARHGWEGKLTPIVAAAGVLYTVVAVVLKPL